MLNYLTLWIKERQIRKDLVNHILEQRVFVHWFSVAISIVNFLFSLYTYLIGGSDLLSLLGNLIYFIGFGPINIIFYFRFKNGLRWTSSAVFICQAALNSYSASSAGQISIAPITPLQWMFNNILGAFLICSVVTGQSDFWIVCILQCPIFIASAIFVSYKQIQENDLIESFLPTEYQYMMANVKASYSQTAKWIVLVGCLILVSLYLQQLDVSTIMIKKWLITK